MFIFLTSLFTILFIKIKPVFQFRAGLIFYLIFYTFMNINLNETHEIFLKIQYTFRKFDELVKVS